MDRAYGTGSFFSSGNVYPIDMCVLNLCITSLGGIMMMDTGKKLYILFQVYNFYKRKLMLIEVVLIVVKHYVFASYMSFQTYVQYYEFAS